MKKSILLAAVGLTVAVSSSFGVGSIMLDNYNTYGPYVTYGPGGAGPVGTGLGAAWTAGIYYANGDVLSLVTPDPTGIADPGALYAGFLLVTGPGSTAAFDFGGTAGTFRATQTLPIAGNPGDTITAMVVAYDGPSYLSSIDRGHSLAFTMPLSLITNPNPSRVGDFMQAFTVPIPEPATLALGSFCGLSLWLMRRKNAQKAQK